MFDLCHLPTVDLPLSEYLDAFLLRFHKAKRCSLHRQKDLLLLNCPLFDEPITVTHDSKGFIIPANLIKGVLRPAKLTFAEKDMHTCKILIRATGRLNKGE